MKKAMFVMAALVVATMVAFAGGTGQIDTPEPATRAVADTASREAPMLAALVDAGELPPLEDRLPANPLVLEPLDGIGEYGGTWRQFLVSLPMWSLWDPPAKKLPTGDFDLVPNVAGSVEPSADLTTWTITIREGMRWSDGEPYTTEDVRFWYEDIILNDAIVPAKPGWFMAGGKLATVNIVDEFTYQVVFAVPNPFFDRNVSRINYEGWDGFNGQPKHYLSSFHEAYADEADLNRIVRESGLESWSQVILEKMKLHENPDVPTLAAWKLVSRPGAAVATFERNPYYWKVDPAGNQLPYIDRLTFADVPDPEVRALRAMAGEVDLTFGFNTDQFPVLRENETGGNFRTVMLNADGLSGAALTLYVNQTFTGNPEVADLLKNKTFRQALSIAIDRDEVNEFIALGLAEPKQSLLNSAHPASSEELNRMYTEFDPDRANRMLDDVGLNRRGADGWRLLPSGAPFTLVISPMGTSGRSVDGGTVVTEHFRAVGINAVLRPEDAPLWRQRIWAGDHQISVFSNGNGFAGLAAPLWYWPMSNSSYWAPLNGLYYATGGNDGVPHEGEQARLLELYELATAEFNEDVQNRYVRESMEIHAENLFQIGVVGYPPWPVVQSNRMRNVPDEYVLGGFNPYLIHPQTFYLER